MVPRTTISSCRTRDSLTVTMAPLVSLRRWQRRAILRFASHFDSSVGTLAVEACQCIDAALARRADARDRLDVLAGEDGGFILQQRLQLAQQARLLFENAAQVLLDVSALERHVAR